MAQCQDNVDLLQFRMSILDAQEEQLDLDEALIMKDEIENTNDTNNEDAATTEDNNEGYKDEYEGTAEQNEVVLVRTSLASNVEAGATKVNPASMAGFRVGYRFRLGNACSGYEERIITGFGSLLFEAPLEQSHGAGTELLMMALSPAERAALKKAERESTQREARQSINDAKAKLSEQREALGKELDIAVADLEDKSQQLPEEAEAVQPPLSVVLPSMNRLEACREEKTELLSEAADIRLQLAKMQDEGEEETSLDGFEVIRQSAGLSSSAQEDSDETNVQQAKIAPIADDDQLAQAQSTPPTTSEFTDSPQAAQLSFDQASPFTTVMDSALSTPTPPPITPHSLAQELSTPTTVRTPSSSVSSAAAASSSWRRATRVVRSANRFQNQRKHTYEGIVIQKDVVIPPRPSSASPLQSSTFRATTPLKRRSRQRYTANTDGLPFSPSSPSPPSPSSPIPNSRRRDESWMSSPLREHQSPTSPRTPGSNARAVVWVYSGNNAIALEPMSSSPGMHALSHAAMAMASLHDKPVNTEEEAYASVARRVRMKRPPTSHPAWVGLLAHVLAQPWCHVFSQTLGPALTAVAIAEAFLDDSGSSSSSLGLPLSSHRALAGALCNHQSLAAKCWALSWVMDACEAFCAHAIRTSPAAVAAAAEAAKASQSSDSQREMVAWKRRAINRKYTEKKAEDSSTVFLGVPKLGRLALRALLLPGLPAFLLSVAHETWSVLRASLSTYGSAALQHLPAGPLLHWAWAHVPPDSGLRLKPLFLRTRLMARWLAWAMPVLRGSWRYMCKAVHKVKTERRQAHERAAIAAAVMYSHIYSVLS